MTAPTKLQSQLKRFFSLILATNSSFLFCFSLIPGFWFEIDSFILSMWWWILTLYSIDIFYDAGLEGGYLGRW